MEHRKNSEPLLNLQHLTIGYKHQAVDKILFNDLNLPLPGGELICFMGPNGIGKSTLIRTLAGLQKSLHGTIEYPHPDLPLSKKIALVLTDKITSANLTVQELITYGRYPFLDWNLKLTDLDKTIIEDAIDQLKIRSLTKAKIFELSDGQLQMVMIARALAQDTSILFMDEPTSHLDLNNRIEIMNLLKKIAHENGKAILVATHELDLALQTADTIWLAHHQQIITGIPEDLILENTFDEVFRFKGFDLKTGKVSHELHRETIIKLSGEGYVYLWTRNALERNGYPVNDSAGEASISIHERDRKISWTLTYNNDTHVLNSIQNLLKMLASVIQ